MRLRSILSEALRNIGSGTAHALAMAIIVLLAGTLMGGYEAMSVVGLENEAVGRINAFADTKTLIGSGDDIDGSACDRLASTSTTNPVRSGAVREGGQITPNSTPGKDIASYEVTPGMLRLITANGSDTGSAAGKTNTTRADASGIWVSKDVAHDFGLAQGSKLETTTGTATIAGVFSWPNDGRDTRFAYALLIPASASGNAFDECWVKQWPTSGKSDSLLYSTVIAQDEDGKPAGITALNKGFDSHYDGQASYASRMTRMMPWLALVLGLLLGILSVRQRRLEYAGALHSGESKGAQLLTVATETLVWSLLGTIGAASLLVAYCVRLAPSDQLAVCLTSIRSPLVLCAGALLGAMLATLTIKESQLFRYFKNR